MIAFTFERLPDTSPPPRWGECEEVVILASDEAQAWQMLGEYVAAHTLPAWKLAEQKPAAPGVIFFTSYTLGV